MIQRFVLGLAVFVSNGVLAQNAPYQEQQGVSPRQAILKCWTITKRFDISVNE